MKQRGFMSGGVGLDLAVLLVSVPRWTRLNTRVTRPDSHANQPLTETLLVLGALSRRGMPYGGFRPVQPRVRAA